MDRRQFIASGSALALVGIAPPTLAKAVPKTGDAALTALLDAVFADNVATGPEDATGLGLDKGANAALKSRLSPRTAAHRQMELARHRRWMARLNGIDPKSLSATGKRNQALARDLFENQIAPVTQFGLTTAQRPYRITQQSGAYFEIPDFLNSQHTIVDRNDAEAYLARLAAFSTALDQDTMGQRVEAAQGLVAPGWSLDLALGQLGKLRGPVPEQNGLVQSLVRRTRDKQIAGNWQERATRIVAMSVYPALDRQIALLTELRKTTPAGDGAWRIPHGAEIYAAALKQATTTDLTPAQVHEVGLDQVAQITAQIDVILKGMGLSSGTVGERMAALNRDPAQLYPDSDAGRADLIVSLNAGIADMRLRLPQAFASVPKQPLEIRRVPIEIQDGAPNGYYNPASLDGSRPAIYWINLKTMANWPKFSLPNLTYHEGIPGHHLQISISQMSGALPKLLANHFISAYGEGWALYAEQLADELGAYSGLDRAGYLQSQLFRATRLVVDTGIHDLRWSRERATDYFAATTGYNRARCLSEISRYCVAMGQACSYKIGHNAWNAAREKAKAALGDKYSLAWFHEILKDGSMPLTMLAARTDERIRERMELG